MSPVDVIPTIPTINSASMVYAPEFLTFPPSLTSKLMLNSSVMKPMIRIITMITALIASILNSIP